MIISFKHKFIYLKMRKTGSTTTEMILARLCGKEDIITPISLRDELERLSRYGVRCQNFTSDKQLEERYHKALHEHLESENSTKPYCGLVLHDSQCEYYNHMPLRLLPQNMVSATRDFTLVFNVRNPYTAILSQAVWGHYANRYNTQKLSHISDKAQFKKILDARIQAALEKIRANVGIVEGYKSYKYFIIRQECLQDDCYRFLQTLDGAARDVMPSKAGDLDVPSAKQLIRNPVSPEALYTWDQIKLINTVCDLQFKDFGYRKISYPQFLYHTLRNTAEGIRSRLGGRDC